jgi:hypothetical protein
VAALEAFSYGTDVIVLGAITALCVAIDGVFPGGQLHNVDKWARNEIRRLQQDVISQWRQAQLGSKKSSPAAVKAILERVRQECARIDKYITDMEASLGETHKPANPSTV